MACADYHTKDGIMSTHRIDARIPDELYHEMRQTKQKTSTLVCAAVEAYLHTETVQQHTGYDREVVDLLKTENQYLKDRLDFFMTPWYLRIFKKQVPQLPAGKPRS